MSELELIVPSKDLLGVMKILSGHGVFHQADSSYPSLDSESGSTNIWQEKASAYSALERRVQIVLQTLGILESQPVSADFQDVVKLERSLLLSRGSKQKSNNPVIHWQNKKNIWNNWKALFASWNL